MTAGLRQLSTGWAAAPAGVLFALLFGATLILIHIKMPQGIGDSTEWLNRQRGGIIIATVN